jgi:phosphohistidine phosphatase SixA
VIYLVREGDAGDRSSWPGPDPLRPITKEGWRQARALVGLMDGLWVGRVLSSPSLRCRQTVIPFADERGLEVETDRLLSDCFSVEMALSALHRIGDVSAVVCTHAEVMEALLQRLPAAPVAQGAADWLRTIEPERLGVAS